MRSRFFRNLLVAVLLSAIPVFGAKFWQTKEFTAWSEKECLEMLRKSPWAYNNTFGNQPAILPDAGTRPASSEPGFGEAQSSTIFEFRVLSAQPIKMAFARLELLKRPNDPELQGRMRDMVNQDPGKEIAIQVSYRVIPSGSSAPHEIHSYFLHASLANFRNNTYLEGDKTGNVQVAGYLAPNQQRPNATFLFPRFNEDGRPIFTGSERSITFRSEFNPEIRGSRRKYNIFVKMKPSEMRFKDAFAF